MFINNIHLYFSLVIPILKQNGTSKITILLLQEKYSKELKLEANTLAITRNNESFITNMFRPIKLASKAGAASRQLEPLSWVTQTSYASEFSPWVGRVCQVRP